jgi:hypothetical protein
MMENARMMVGHQQSSLAGPFRAIVRFWDIASAIAVQRYVWSWGRPEVTAHSQSNAIDPNTQVSVSF